MFFLQNLAKDRILQPSMSPNLRDSTAFLLVVLLQLELLPFDSCLNNMGSISLDTLVASPGQSHLYYSSILRDPNSHYLCSSSLFPSVFSFKIRCIDCFSTSCKSSRAVRPYTATVPRGLPSLWEWLNENWPNLT